MIILRPRKYTLLERVYLLEVVRGMSITMRHFLSNVWGALTHERVIPTWEYPEEPLPVPPRARNCHRLLLNEKGEPKCVACLMCETICPAQCISIVARESDDDVKEKVCESFVIDELRCIFCGFCVEACPKDAIRMDTDIPGVTYRERDEFVYDRARLLDLERRTDIEDGEEKK